MMAILDPIPAHALAVRLISNVDPGLARTLGLRPDQRALGLLTADNDDATYVSIDDATKMADVEVIYAHSFYAGAKHASGLLSGEIIAMLAGPDPAEVRAGLNAAVHLSDQQRAVVFGQRRRLHCLLPARDRAHRQLPGQSLRNSHRRTGGLPDRPTAGRRAGAGRGAQGGRRAHCVVHRAALRNQLHGRHSDR